jgi:hypothetical protein
MGAPDVVRCQARCARAARRTVVALFGMVKALFIKE